MIMIRRKDHNRSYRNVWGPAGTIINKRGLGLGYYEYKDRTPGGHQIANSQSVLIPAGV